MGNKYTYADLAFIPWGWLVPWVTDEDFVKDLEKSLPHYWAWWERVSARSATAKVKKDRETAMSKGQ